MTAIQNWHIILLCHLVNGIEQRKEVLFGIDILFSVSTQQNVFTLLQAQTLVNIAGLNLSEIVVQHLGHRAASHVSTLLGQTCISQISTSMLAISHVHIRNDVNDSAVGLLWQTLVLTAVTCLHVEDGDVQALRANN